MHVLIYIDVVRLHSDMLRSCAPIVQQIATALTLMTDTSGSPAPLLERAVAQLGVPRRLPLDVCACPGALRSALRAAPQDRPYDLLIYCDSRRSLLAPHSTSLVQRLPWSTLCLRAAQRSVRRILLASGGERHTLDHVRFVAQLAQPFGAAVTILHVLSQQSLLFTGFYDRSIDAAAFLASRTSAAQILGLGAAWLEDDGIPAQLVVRTGPVVSTIVDELRAGAYDLLVVGDHRPERALDRLLLRNMANELLAASPRSVLVVKGSSGV